MRVLKLVKRIRCPKRTLIISNHDQNPALESYHWRFGPDTVNPWPSGDYYSDGAYYGRSGLDYHEFYRDREYRREYQEHPAYMQVDIGL